MKLAALPAIVISLLAGPPEGLKWIAHRGGVVDTRYSENSPASLEAAVQHGYWMIESDIRETRDGKMITHHDPDFKLFYGDPRRVSEVTLAEAKKLRAEPGGTPPMTLQELAAACRGRLRLMLDVKEPEHSLGFYQEMERELKKADLLESAYVIGLDSSRKFFKGKARVGVDAKQLRAAIAKSEPVSKLYFLFEWGKTLTPDVVKFAQQHSVSVVPSINTFHYGRDMAQAMRAGSEDVKRMIRLGVTEFQIDSVYEPAFR